MKKNFEVFMEQDHREHLERSLDALTKHADPGNELTMEERKEYFKGLMGMFPVMLLGHYYGWLIEEEPKDYFEIFAPRFRERYEYYACQTVNRIFDEQASENEKSVLLSSYLQTYPFDLLREFVFWAGPDALEKAGIFVAKERCDYSVTLSLQITKEIEQGDHVKLAVYLAGDYPFELISRFHRAVME